MATAQSDLNHTRRPTEERSNGTSRRNSAVLWATRVAGAMLLLFVGADHYYQYSARDYSVIPTIGPLFLLNFISATVVGLLLLVPFERLLPRTGRVALALTTASGAAIAATSLIALLISEQTKLFGFMEFNYRPEIVIAIVTEAAAALVLSVFTLLVLRSALAARRTDRPVKAQPRAGVSPT